MFRLTVQRCMHDRKIPNITRSHVFPTVQSSYDSPKKYDQSKPTNREERKWKSLWPKFRVHSQQYRGYKATRGDGQAITPVFDVEDKLWVSEHPKPHEHAEAEEEAIWGEINHDYTDMDSVENDGKSLAHESFKRLFKKTTT